MSVEDAAQIERQWVTPTKSNLRESTTETILANTSYCNFQFLIFNFQTIFNDLIFKLLKGNLFELEFTIRSVGER
jgi:hypothetical protein